MDEQIGRAVVTFSRSWQALTARHRDVGVEPGQRRPHRRDRIKRRALEDIHAEANARHRFAALLLGVAAGVGLFLGAIGVYGVISWATRQRTAELGIRAAFGARAIDLLRMIMGRAGVVVGAGLVAGLVASAALNRLLAAMLYGVEATDPLTFIAVTMVLAAVAAGATWMPARRASKIDPVEALRAR